MERSSESQSTDGLTLYFLGKLHNGLKKLSAYYRTRGTRVFNITSPEELERALQQGYPNALIIDLQTRADITSFFDVLGHYEGLLELPRVAIISSTTDEETRDALTSQADDAVVWPLKATDLSAKLFALFVERDCFMRLQKDSVDGDGTVYRGEITPHFIRDIVQLLLLARTDGIVSLESDGRRGNLYFKEGKLIDAQVGALEWEDSLRLLIRFREGTFVLTFQSVDRKRFIDKNISAWLAHPPEEGTDPSVYPPSAPEREGHPGGEVEETVPRIQPGRKKEEEDTGVMPKGTVISLTGEADAAETVEALEAEGEEDDVSGSGQEINGVARLSVLDHREPALPLTTPEPVQAPAESPREALRAAVAPIPEADTEDRKRAPVALVPPPAQMSRPGGSVKPTPAPEPASANNTEIKVAAVLAALVLLSMVGLFYYRFQPAAGVASRFGETVTPRPAPPTPSAGASAPPQERVSPPAEVIPPPEIIRPSPTPAPVVSAPPAPPVPVAVKPPEPVPNATPEPSAPVRTPTPGPNRPVPLASLTPTLEKPAPVAPKPPVSTVKSESPPPAPVATPVPVPEPPTPAPTPVAVAEAPRVSSPETTVELAAGDRPERYLRKGRELERAGKIQEALSYYNRAAEIDPTSREAAESISRLKNLQEANPLAPGSLKINSYPYGIVYVDGERHGYTPVHLPNMVPRKYLIRVVNPELGACSSEYVLKPGENKVIQLRLDDNENCQRTRNTP